MPKACPDCGAAEGEKAFYPTSIYCCDCHNTRMVNDRKQTHRRPKVNDYNNRWLKANPVVNRRAQQRWRDRQRAQRVSQVIPPNLMTVQEAMTHLGLLSRFRVVQLIDSGKLRAIKERGRWLIVRVDVEQLVAERQAKAGNEDKT